MDHRVHCDRPDRAVDPEDHMQFSGIKLWGGAALVQGMVAICGASYLFGGLLPRDAQLGTSCVIRP